MSYKKIIQQIEDTRPDQGSGYRRRIFYGNEHIDRYGYSLDEAISRYHEHLVFLKNNEKIIKQKIIKAKEIFEKSNQKLKKIHDKLQKKYKTDTEYAGWGWLGNLHYNQEEEDALLWEEWKKELDNEKTKNEEKLETLGVSIYNRHRGSNSLWYSDDYVTVNGYRIPSILNAELGILDGGDRIDRCGFVSVNRSDDNVTIIWTSLIR